MKTLLQCVKMQIAYDGRTVVQDVSFDVHEGEYLCIVGENGSGKSTLLKGILKLVPLKGGSVIFGDGLRRREIGYLPQQSALQKDFPASVQEVVQSGCLSGLGRRLFYGKADRERAQQNMKDLHIWDIRKKSYRELSGGQQQRVLLARALCAADKLLLLDEPVTGLDPLVTAELYETIRALNRTRGLTILMVSHDIASAAQYADKILHLDAGVEFFGTAQDYLQSDIGRRFAKGI